MAMNRLQLKYRQMQAKYEADSKRPPTRAQAKAWLQPLRDAFNEMRKGEVDMAEFELENGEKQWHAVTKMRWIDGDYARIDYCINGFLGMTDRTFPTLNTTPLYRVSKRLSQGEMIDPSDVDACLRVIGKCEDLLLTVSRQTLKDAAQTEMIRIELDRMAA